MAFGDRMARLPGPSVGRLAPLKEVCEGRVEVAHAGAEQIDGLGAVQVDDDQPPGVFLDADPPAALEILLIGEVPEPRPVARHLAQLVAQLQVPIPDRG